MNRAFLLFCLLVALLAISVVPAFADSTFTMNFHGATDGQAVGDFYNGGAGPDYGVSFSSSVIGLKSMFKGGSGNFAPFPANNPMFNTAIFFQTNSGIMNVAQGFTTGLNFFYTAAFSGTVTIWSGADGTGTILATMTFSANDGSCSGAPAFCNWTDVGMSFSGTAKSVTFSGPANAIGISEITVGSNAPAIPEPSSLYLLGTGIVTALAGRGRRFLGLS